MTRILILATVVGVMMTSPASAACILSYCKGETGETSTREIRSNWNNGRQRVGDLYYSGRGGRVQIRNNSRQILGFIESDGTITNRSRQEVLSIETVLP